MDSKDEVLRERITSLLKENGINSLHGLSAKEIVDSFMRYTPIGREYIIEYYSNLIPTKRKMNWIEKTDFEDKYFYIGGTDALTAMLLLGYKVNTSREANFTKISLTRLKNQNKNYSKRIDNFFKRNNLKSKDINTSWNDWI